MAYKLSNFCRMSLAQSVSAAATTMFVSAEDGDKLPTLGVGDSSPVVLFNQQYAEIVYVTAEADGALTVTRAREGTTARDWPSGTVVIGTPTAEILQTAANLALASNVFIGTCTNVGNDYTVDVGVGNAIPALTGGERVSFLISADSTGPVTLVVTNGVSSTIAKDVTHQDGRQLQDGDFQEDWLAEVFYDVVNDTWLLLSETSLNEHAAQLNDGPVPAVSRHPNGRLDYWNNGTSFSTPASLTETADGWFPEYDGAIGTFTVNRQTFTLGQTDVPWSPTYFIRWAQSAAGAGSSVRRFRVPIPNVAWRGGETVTRSVWMKADVARDVTARLIQYFGSGGAPSADVTVNSTVCSLNTSWQRFDITATLPSVTGKTLGSDGNDALVLTLDLPVNVTMTIDVAVDDFRPGDVPGRQSDTFPLPTRFGGLGGSFATLNAALALVTNVVHTTGNETIAGDKTFSGIPLISNTAPRLGFQETDQALDEKGWAIAVNAKQLMIQTRTDADAFGASAIAITRGAGTALLDATLTIVALGPAGSASAPTWSFSGDPNTGIWNRAADQVGITCGGTDLAFFATSGMGLVTGQFFAPDGSAGGPTYSFTNDTDCGLYRIGANNIGVAAGGALVFDWNATRLQMANGFDVVLPTTAHAPTSAYSAGYRGAPVISGNSAYAFPASDAGHTIYHDEASARTWTIPANASVPHPIGTVFILDNTGNAGAAGTITLNITSDTLRRGDGVSGTGSRSILASQVAIIRKSAATIWTITGNFS